MIKIKPAILFFLLACSISGLRAQTFNPIDGRTYPVEFITWTINGDDKLPVMQSYLRSGAITFNPDNTVINFGNTLYKASYTFFSDGNCEVAIKALFIQRSVLGIGSIERSGRDFTLSLSMRSEAEAEDIITYIKGIIK